MQRKHCGDSARRPATRIIRWATETYRGRLGEYIGVALGPDGLKIGIRTPLAPRWVDAIDAMTVEEAQAWARVGFRKSGNRG
jgi:hypothetical protein